METDQTTNGTIDEELVRRQTLTGEAIERYRRKLLDTSGRNPLISFKHSERSKKQIRVIDEMPDLIFRRLAGGGSFTFLPLKKPAGFEPADERTKEFRAAIKEGKRSDIAYLRAKEGLGKSPSKRALYGIEIDLRNRIRQDMGLPPVDRVVAPEHADIARKMGLNPCFDLPRTIRTGRDEKYSDGALQTLYFEEELESRLGTIYQQAQLEEAERGAPTLHIAFGFLEWYESEDSDEKIVSPLLLLPTDVDRVRDGSKVQFPVCARDEDLLLNLSLKERLLNDFRFILPGPRSADGEDVEAESPEAYLERLQQAISDYPRWKIHSWVTLSFFSFVRLALYEDLNPINWTNGSLAQNAGLIELFTAQDREPRGGASFDEREPAAASTTSSMPLHIADADSSQLNALITALSGKNMVIDGPPGTGKSQTITNLIAAALSEGKRVLFVCEKLAALNVVQKRLEKAGLDRFCLELHSGKAKKTEVLKSLEERLAVGHGRGPADYERKLSDLEDLKKSLNQYSCTMNRPIDGESMTPFEVLGRCSSLDERLASTRELLMMVTLDAANFHRLDLPSLRHALDECERSQRRAIEQLGETKNSPFVELIDPSSDLFEIESALRSIREVSRLLAQTLEEVDSLGFLGLPRNVSIPELQKLLADLSKLPNPTDLTSVVLQYLLDYQDGDSRLDQLIDDLEAAPGLLTAVSNIFSSPKLVGPGAIGAIERVSAGVDRGVLTGTEPLHSDVESVDRRIADFRSILGRLDFVMPMLGLESAFTLFELKRLALAAELAAELTPEALMLLSPQLLAETAEKLIKEGELSSQEIAGQLEGLARVAAIVPDPDLEALTVDVETIRASGFFDRFRKSYKKAYRNLIQRLRPIESMSRDRLVNLADQTIAVYSARKDFERRPEYRDIFGSHYAGIQSPFRTARALCDWIWRISSALSITDPFDCRLRELLLSGDKTRHEVLRESHKQRLFNLAFEKLEHNPGIGFRESVEKLEVESGPLREAASALEVCGIKFHVTVNDLSGQAGAILSFAENSQRLGRQENLSLIGESASDQVIANLKQAVAHVDSIRALTPEVRDMLLQPAVLAMFSANREKLITFSDRLREVLRVTEGVSPQALLVGLPFTERRVPELVRFFSEAVQKSDGVPAYVVFALACERARSLGLSPLLQAFDNGNVPFLNLSDGFEFLWCRSVIKSVLAGNPKLSTFFGLQHEQVRLRFAQLDRECLRLHQKYLVSRLANVDIPEGQRYGRASELTDLSLIEREIKKRKRHIALRALLARAGSAVQTLKPCFMMSPLSVAQFLQPGRLHFHLVVMDEASQIRPEDALGAIARGSQIVIVGDPKQLPPTNFFNRLELEVDEGDEDEVNAVAFDSVLDLAQSWRKEGLRWHYRSRHESLIAFSNREFYDDELIVFPGPHDRAENFGVRFIRVNGRYVAHRNIEEARKIVSEVVAASAADPSRSIGVVAVNQEQRDLLIDLFEDETRSNALFRSYVERWEGTLEPFFNKNLENVQGDERDVIFISCVYGKDADGNFFQRFGPINNAMGHRRLNVLFTRAKYQMVVAASFDPEEVIVDESSSAGLKAFRGFLEYARTRALPPVRRSSAQAPEPSEFENSVKRALEAAGHIVEGQIGVAGYFIDLAVRGKNVPGGFLIGIECDGSTYHSARSARDRDRLREEILVGLGWKIIRIWSLDWFRNPRKEMERLLDAIAFCQDEANANAAQPVPSATPLPNHPVDSPGNQYAEEETDSDDPPVEPIRENRPTVVAKGNPIFEDVFLAEITREEKTCSICNKERDVMIGRFGPYARCDGKCGGKNASLSYAVVNRVIGTLSLTCDECKAPAMVVNGPTGIFVGCSRYPHCKAISYWSNLRRREI